MRQWNSLLSALAVAGVGLLAGTSASASDNAPSAPRNNRWPGPQGDTWQSIARLPNWQGAWALDRDTFKRGVQAAINPNQNSYSAPLNPKWEAYRLSNGAANGGDGPTTGTVNNATRCLPDGMPALMSAPHTFMFLFQPGLVVVLAEHGEYRVIHTDGRSHPDDPDLKWDGDSIGHWEKDTLVIDTIGINPRAEIFMGLPNASDKTHVVERLRLDARDQKLHLNVTVTNPDEFTRAYSYANTFERAPNGLLDSYCQENNRDTDQGKTNLKPPGN